MEDPLKKKLHHYHLVATEVAFLEPQNQQIGQLKINVLMRTPTRSFTARDMGKSQQIAQMQLFEKLQDQTLEVKDVFLIAVSYLGQMTEEHFQAPPAGTVKQERTAAEPTAPTPFDA
jgi:hypothetical protein